MNVPLWRNEKFRNAQKEEFIKKGWEPLVYRDTRPKKVKIQNSSLLITWKKGSFFADAITHTLKNNFLHKNMGLQTTARKAISSAREDILLTTKNNILKYILSTMGVSKESISKFLIGNRFHIKLRILSPENRKQS